MAKQEKKAPKQSRVNTLARIREEYPDRTFDELDAETASEGASDLDDAIDEALENLIKGRAESSEKNAALKKLLLESPDMAEFVQRWVDTGDPQAAFVEMYGDQFGISDEGREAYKGQIEDWRKRKADNDALEAEAPKNWEESLGKLKSWGDAKGLSAQQQTDVMVRLLSIVFNGMENKYNEDDFNLAWNAINHDADVAAARHEGEVAGKNARAEAKRHERAFAGTMPPAAAGGQAGGVKERQPAQEDDNPFHGIV